MWLAGRQMQAQPNAEHIAICEAARAAVAARNPGVEQALLFADLPPELQPHIEGLRGNPVTAAILASSGDVRLVDLRRVCAAQPQIHIEDAIKRVAGIGAGDVSAIADVTLPLHVDIALPVAFDQSKNSWIISAANPNLRVVGHFNAPVAPGVLGFGFAVALHKSYLQVAGLNGRYFLRDGYHRAYGLLAAGIHQVPALVKDFASFEEVGLPAGLLPQAAYLGDRPPLLPDYLNDSVAADTLLPITQKMIVIQGLELNSLG